MPTKTYGSHVFAAVHETASDLHEAGLLEKRTLRDFEGLCLTPIAALGAKEIKELREREQVSQAVLARYLNVSTGVVSQWERGEKKPGGASLKLLTLVREKGLAAIA